jgi:hypothetical protein
LWHAVHTKEKNWQPWSLFQKVATSEAITKSHNLHVTPFQLYLSIFPLPCLNVDSQISDRQNVDKITVTENAELIWLFLTAPRKGLDAICPAVLK